MALTTLVKDELASYDAPKISARKAEISTILRFTGGLHIVSGRIVVESEVDHEPTAHRMRRIISEIYGHDSELTSVTGGGLRRGGRYVVRVDQGGEALARQTGLLDVRGRPVRGLPPAVVNGSLQDAEAVMRGAFLAHGSLTEPGRSSALEFTCPGPEAALALVGAARRLEIIAKAREVRGTDRVVVRDGETIAQLLERMGATGTLTTWREARTRKEVRATANRLANFDDANLAPARPGRRGGQRPRGARPRNSGRSGPRTPALRGGATRGEQARLSGRVGSPGRAAHDEGRDCGPYSPPAGHGR